MEKELLTFEEFETELLDLEKAEPIDKVSNGLLRLILDEMKKASDECEKNRSGKKMSTRIEWAGYVSIALEKLRSMSRNQDSPERKWEA